GASAAAAGAVSGTPASSAGRPPPSQAANAAANATLNAPLRRIAPLRLIWGPSFGVGDLVACGLNYGRPARQGPGDRAHGRDPRGVRLASGGAACAWHRAASRAPGTGAPGVPWRRAR